MRLEALLQNLHNNPCDEIKEYPIDEGTHTVSNETAHALANLAQFIAAHGMVVAQQARPDLFTAVATTLLKPSHACWGKNLQPDFVPAETMQAQGLDDLLHNEEKPLAEKNDKAKKAK